MDAVQDAHPVDPTDTTRLRRLLGPIMRRNEKHTLMHYSPAEDAFLHSLITEGITPLIDEFVAFAGPYEAAVAAQAREAATGTTPDSAPREPAAAPRSFPRPAELAALDTDAFMREVHLLSIDELERLAVPPLDGEVDVFDEAQRTIIDDILKGRRASNVFEIQCTDPIPASGELVEYEGRMVVMLGLSETEDRMRVAYVDTELRRDDAASTDARTPPAVETPPSPADFTCVDCDHEPAAALKGHRTKEHAEPEPPD